MSPGLDKSILTEGETLFLEGKCRLGRKRWFGNEFSQHDSSYYLTSRRILLHTPKRSWLEKVTEGVLLSAVGQLMGSSPAQIRVGKNIVKFNPNEGDILEIPLGAVEKIEVRIRDLFIPVNEVMLFISGEVLPLELEGVDLKGTAAKSFAEAFERVKAAVPKAA